MAKEPYRKVPVAKNAPPEDVCFYLDLKLEINAADEEDAKTTVNAIVYEIRGYDMVAVVSQTLTRENEAGGEPVFIDGDEENEADTALRKLTRNKGNKLWIDYLQQQLKLARGLKE